nr:unnamed protein product [Callosobruchus chinensis]
MGLSFCGNSPLIALEIAWTSADSVQSRQKPNNHTGKICIPPTKVKFCPEKSSKHLIWTTYLYQQHSAMIFPISSSY